MGLDGSDGQADPPPHECNLSHLLPFHSQASQKSKHPSLCPVLPVQHSTGLKARTKGFF